MQDTDAVYRRWIDSFRFAYERCPGGVFALTVHPQAIGRAQHMLMFVRFVHEVREHDQVWFATLSEIADSWRD